MIFGGDDIFITDNCNKNEESYSNLGSSYKLPDGIKYDSDEAKTYLGG